MATNDIGKQPSQMTDEERNEYIKKVNKDLDDFLDEQLRKSSKNNAPEDKSIDELLAELDEHPAFMKEIKPSDMDNEYVQALMSLKYETEDATENAESFKEEGNMQFKIKKYKWAIDNYTAGINEKCQDKDLNAILYSNRAAANFHRGNFGSALRDATFARKFKKDHMKAIIKGAECCIKLNKFADAIKWCKYGILIDESQEKLKKLNEEAESKLAEKKKKERKELAERKRNLRKKMDLISAIKSRGIKLTHDGKLIDYTNEDEIERLDLENCHSGVSVNLALDGSMVWPVMFVYPEYGQTDFIQEFEESNTFSSHLKVMFSNEGEPVPWDIEFKYKYNNLDIFYENREERKLYKVRPNSSLLEVLKQKKFFVEDGTPAFILLPKKASFSDTFLQKYKFET